VLPDGKGFVFVSNAIQPEIRELKLVLNWFEDLKRRVRGPKAPSPRAGRSPA
jgi:hypothetical protein